MSEDFAADYAKWQKNPKGAPPRDLEGEAMLRDARVRDTNQRHLGMLKDLGRGGVLGLNEGLYGLLQNPYSPSGEQGLIGEQAARLQNADERGIAGALGERTGSIPERTGEFAAMQLMLKGIGGLFAGGGAVAANPAITRIPVGIAQKAAEQGARSVPRMLTEEAVAAGGAGAGSYYGEKHGGRTGEVLGAVGGGFMSPVALAMSRPLIRGGLRMIPGASEAIGALSEASPTASRFLPRISVEQQAADKLGRAVGGDRAAILAQMENARPMTGVDPTMAGLATVGSEAGPVAHAGVRSLERQVASENPSMATQQAVRVAEGRRTLDARLDAVRRDGRPEELRRVFETEVAADRGRDAMRFDVQTAAETSQANAANTSNQAMVERALAKQREAAFRETAAYRQGKEADANLFAAERFAAEREVQRLEGVATASAKTVPGDASVSSMGVQAALSDAERAVFKPLSGRYEAIFGAAERTGVKLQTTDVVRTVDNLVPTGSEIALTLPGDVSTAISALKQNVSWSTLANLDKALTGAVARSSSRAQAYQLQEVQSAVRMSLHAPAVEAQLERALPKELRGKGGLSGLRREYANASETYRRGEVGEAVSPNPYRRTPGSSVVQKIIRPNTSEGAVEEANRFRDAIRGHPEAVQQADEAILAVGARDHFLDGGRVDVKAARKWLTDYSDALTPFPTVRARVEELIRVEQEAVAAKARVPVEARKGPPFRATKQPKVDKPKTVQPESVASPEAERSLRTEFILSPSATVKDLIARGDMDGIARLHRYAGRTVRGSGDLRAAAMDFVLSETGTAGSAGLTRVLNRHEAALRGFLEPQDLREIRAVAEQFGHLERTEAAIPASSLHPAQPGMADSLTVGVSPITGSPIARIRESSPIHRMFGGVRDARVRAKLEAAFLGPRGAGVRLLRQVRGPNEIPLNNRYLVNPAAVVLTESTKEPKRWPKGHR